MVKKPTKEPMALEPLKIAGILVVGIRKPPPQEVFNEMFRVAKNLIIFGGNYFGNVLPPSNCWIFWDKKGDIAFQNPFSDGELIYTTFKKPVKKIVFRQQGFITDSKDKRYHPTQKPTELVQTLIEMFSEPGQVICDPFLGERNNGHSRCESWKALHRL